MTLSSIADNDEFLPVSTRAHFLPQLQFLCLSLLFSRAAFLTLRFQRAFSRSLFSLLVGNTAVDC